MHFEQMQDTKTNLFLDEKMEFYLFIYCSNSNKPSN